MDHLLLPSEPLHDPVSVPYLCTKEYDGELWVYYCDRQGLVDLDLNNPSFWTNRYDILQNWLWFGPLHFFFGAKVTKRNLTRKLGRDRIVLDTSKLSGWIRHWWSDWVGLSEEEKPVVEIDTTRTLKFWYSIFQRIRSNDETGRLLLFSISVLHEALFNMWTHIHPSASLQSLNFRSQTAFRLPECEDTLLWKKMLKEGWCPQQLANLMMLPPSTRYYASLMGGPDRDRNHSTCSVHRCHAYGAMVTKHTEDGCKCAMVSTDQKLMSSILLAGFFPLIRIVKDPKKGVSLVITQYHPGMKYVAFSHVWSDGLGNPNGNSLPQCQLERLATVAEEALQPESIHEDDLEGAVAQIGFDLRTRGPLSIWIDTICCPVASGFPAAHTKSLAMMPFCYHEATRVVVLDRYIEAFPPVQKRFMRRSRVAKVTPLERMMRIRFSRWTQRLWTLQEGSLAKQLFVRFSDGFFEFDRLTSEVMRSALTDRGSVPEDMRAFLGTIRCTQPHILDSLEYRDRRAFLHTATRPGRDQSQVLPALDETWRLISDTHADVQAERAKPTAEEAFLKHLARICQGVSTRSLSVSSDEPICLGILLGLNVETLASTEPDRRMEKFWEMLPHYSRSLVHFHGQARTSTTGLSWRPTSLINRPTQGDLWVGLTTYSDAVAKPSELGLHVTFPGAISSVTLTTPLPRQFIFHDKQSGDFWTVDRKSGRPELPFPRLFGGAFQIGLILLSDTDLTAPQPPAPKKEEAIAALLVISVGVFSGSPELSSFDYVLTGPLVELINNGPDLPEVHAHQSVVEGLFVPASHQWCVRGSIGDGDEERDVDNAISQCRQALHDAGLRGRNRTDGDLILQMLSLESR